MTKEHAKKRTPENLEENRSIKELRAISKMLGSILDEAENVDVKNF